MRAVCVLLILMFPASVFGQAAGIELKALQNNQLRSSPPEGFFLQQGKVTGNIEEGTTVKLEEMKQVNTAFGTYEYGKVRSVDPINGDESVGWTYMGKEGETGKLFQKIDEDGKPCQ